jgi:hypothetical protein
MILIIIANKIVCPWPDSNTEPFSQNVDEQ